MAMGSSADFLMFLRQLQQSVVTASVSCTVSGENYDAE